jgi:hypothetical protein
MMIFPIVNNGIEITIPDQWVKRSQLGDLRSSEPRVLHPPGGCFRKTLSVNESLLS